MSIKGRNEYFKRIFGNNFEQDSRLIQKQKEALNRAHDIRKFEIELYWKRALYFWGFQVAIFAGLIATKTGNTPDGFLALFFSLLGLMISIAWYFVNIGAKFWHENWEHHVDLLEYEITGNLHKNVLSYEKRKNNTYSASRINKDVSLLFLGAWLVLVEISVLKSLHDFFEIDDVCIYVFTAFPVFAFLVACMILLGKRWKTDFNTCIKPDGETLDIYGNKLWIRTRDVEGEQDDKK